MTTHSILDDSFCYVPAIATSVAETWRRFGWRPTTEEERKRRRKRITTQTSQVIVGHFGDKDPTAQVPLEQSLAEEVRANDKHELPVSHEDRPSMQSPLHSERREAESAGARRQVAWRMQIMSFGPEQ